MLLSVAVASAVDVLPMCTNVCTGSEFTCGAAAMLLDVRILLPSALENGAKLKSCTVSAPNRKATPTNIMVSPIGVPFTVR